MVRKVPGWTEVIVRACLEGMGELDEDETNGLEEWLREDVIFFFSFLLICIDSKFARYVYQNGCNNTKCFVVH